MKHLSVFISVLLAVVSLGLVICSCGRNDSIIPTLTEENAKEIIKKANRRESNAMTKDYNKVYEMAKIVPCQMFVEDYDGGADEFCEGFANNILSCDEYYPDNIEVIIKQLDISKSSDAAKVDFFYGDSENEQPEWYNNNFDRLVRAYLILEDGEWKVDDVVYLNGPYSWDSLKESDRASVEKELKAIRSGNLEKWIQKTYYSDAKCDEYLNKTQAFKEKYNL